MEKTLALSFFCKSGLSIISISTQNTVNPLYTMRLCLPKNVVYHSQSSFLCFCGWFFPLSLLCFVYGNTFLLALQVGIFTNQGIVYWGMTVQTYQLFCWTGSLHKHFKSLEMSLQVFFWKMKKEETAFDCVQQVSSLKQKKYFVDLMSRFSLLFWTNYNFS